MPCGAANPTCSRLSAGSPNPRLRQCASPGSCPNPWRTHSCVPRSHFPETSRTGQVYTAPVRNLCLARKYTSAPWQKNEVSVARDAPEGTVFRSCERLRLEPAGMSSLTRRLALILPVLFLSACAVGPNYKRPAAVVAPAYKEPPPEAFKEAQAAGLQPANPSDAFQKGKWWEIYNDPALNALEEHVDITIKTCW